MKKSETLFGLLRIPIDFTLVIVGFLLGYGIRTRGDFIPGMHFPLDLSSFPPVHEYMELVISFALMLVLVFFVFGLYKVKNSDGPLRESRKVIAASFVWVLLIIAYYFAVRQVFFSRLVLGFSFALTLSFLVSARWLLQGAEHLLLRAGIGAKRTLIIGSGKLTQSFIKSLSTDPHYHLLGYLSKNAATKLKGLKRLGHLVDLEKTVKKFKIESIIQTSQNLTELQTHDLIEFCREHHLEYSFLPDTLEIDQTNVEVSTVGGLPLIHLKPTPLDGWGRVYKRSVDIVGSLVGLILFSPIMLLIALGIKLDSKGPILFSRLEDGSRAERIGQNGKPFPFYKFRTMKHNSHKLRFKKDFASKSHRKGPLLKIKNDPRITKFGKILRRTSLDELPQLWSVLRGHMSLVGPRPHLPDEVAKYQSHHRFLLTIKPGATGLSQISGRSDLDFEEEARLESYYIKQWSPWLDLKIMLKTVIVVLKGNAAD